MIKQVCSNYGSQAVIGSIDVKAGLFVGKAVYSHMGNKIKYNLEDYAKYLVNDLGVGEIMIQSVDREGTWEGFDEEITEKLISAVQVPIIASGGCGKTDDLKNILYKCHASAAAIGSMAVYSKKGMGVLINFPNRTNIIQEN